MLLSPVLLGSGCSLKTSPASPQAPAVQTLYNTLIVAQATLNSLRNTLDNPATPAATVAILKPYVNQAITDYDIAEVAWQAYNAALASNPSASSTQAQAAISKVQTDLQNVPKVQ